MKFNGKQCNNIADFFEAVDSQEELYELVQQYEEGGGGDRALYRMDEFDDLLEQVPPRKLAKMIKAAGDNFNPEHSYWMEDDGWLASFSDIETYIREVWDEDDFFMWMEEAEEEDEDE